MKARSWIAVLGVAATTSACSLQTSYPELYNDHYYWAARQAIVIGEPELAEGYLLKSAENGDYASMAFLGSNYARGLGVEQDTEKAVYWFEKAIAEPSGKYRSYAKSVGDAYGRQDSDLYDSQKAEKFWKIALNYYTGLNKLRANEAMVLASMQARGKGITADGLKAIKIIEANDGASVGKLARLAGDIEYNGLGKAIDLKSAARWYEIAAEAGDLERLRQLGDMYTYGRGVAVDLAKAQAFYAEYVDYLESKFSDGQFVHASNKRSLAHLYANGLGVKANGARAIAILEEIANEDEGLNARLIGDIYYSALGLSQSDKAKAFKWYTKSVDLGATSRLVRLGHMYAKGEGVTADQNKADETWVKAITTLEMHGDKRSGWETRTLAGLYANGYGAKKDYARAMALYGVGVKAGDGASARAGGDAAYDNGDFVKARSFYQQAIDLGDTVRVERYADMLVAGQGGRKDPAAALSFYKLYAQNLDQKPLTDVYSKLRLARLYRGNKLGQPDSQKALQQYLSVADKLAIAAIEAGDVYYSGELGSPDYAKAVELYFKSADLGEKSRIGRLIYMYKNGKGVEKDAAVVSKLQAMLKG